MQEGYIRIPRKLLSDKKWLKLPDAYKVLFLYILANCVYKSGEYSNGKEVVNLSPGQMLTSERFLASSQVSDPHFSRPQIQRTLRRLVRDGFIKKRPIHTFNEKAIHTSKRKNTIIEVSREWFMTNQNSGCDPHFRTQADPHPDPHNDPVNILKEEGIKKNVAQTAAPLRCEVVFSFADSSFKGITDKDLSNWQELYPAVDVRQEIRLMEEWCLSNQTKSRSKKLWRRFINNWLSRSNEQKINKLAFKGANERVKSVTEKRDGEPKFKGRSAIP